MNRAAYYNYIEERIVTLCTRVELRGKINILDYHLHSENFYRDLFNKLFAWNLENLNSEIQNVEAIDLIDKSNNIAIQVSATNTKSKIDNALRLESNLSSIINLLSKKDFTSIERNTKINSFEIERKIDFNKLDTSKEIIEEYKLYHHIVDKIYAEFDKSGCNKSISVLNTIKGEYIKNSSKLMGDGLFDLVISTISERILQSSNFEKIPREEMEMCVGILVVDAFIRCKIFKNPNDYNYATP